MTIINGKMSLCNDCKKKFEIDLTIRAISLRYDEVYYEGEGICNDCCNKRYESFIRSKENENNGRA